jgi:hypothetical protein
MEEGPKLLLLHRGCCAQRNWSWKFNKISLFSNNILLFKIASQDAFISSLGYNMEAMEGLFSFLPVYYQIRFGSLFYFRLQVTL